MLGEGVDGTSRGATSMRESSRRLEISVHSRWKEDIPQYIPQKILRITFSASRARYPPAPSVSLTEADI